MPKQTDSKIVSTLLSINLNMLYECSRNDAKIVPPKYIFSMSSTGMDNISEIMAIVFASSFTVSLLICELSVSSAIPFI